MKNSRRGQLGKYLLEEEFEQAVRDAQKADENRLVRRLCHIKNLYQSDTRAEADKRVGIPGAS